MKNGIFGTAIKTAITFGVIGALIGGVLVTIIIKVGGY